MEEKGYETMREEKLYFASDYQEGMADEILVRLQETNRTPTAGYGQDPYSESARTRIREAIGIPEAEIYFLSGGTQTNATVIDGLLRGYEGVIAADTGHIAMHEAGAIEFGGHKVLTVAGESGKIRADILAAWLKAFYQDGNHDHMVFPGMVYISQPTEYGTLYSLGELTELRGICDTYGLKLYVDGARLAYALASEENTVSLADLGRLCDVFYIGGTKCGAVIGEALVIAKPQLIPHFFTVIKQHGALLAKGRLAGVSFDTLFDGGLYERLGRRALRMADTLRKALVDQGWRFLFETSTNQIFLIIENGKYEKLQEDVVCSYWEPFDEKHTVIRLATSWATGEREIEQLIQIMKRLS